MTGLYIHIPFCHARCGYCDFVTFTGKEDQQDNYIAQLVRELTRYPPSAIQTLFLGGGTPSVLTPSQIGLLFHTVRQHFAVQSDAEITIEANPESITREKLDSWRAAGINRISIGLQAYDDALLKAMGRLHTAEQFSLAYDLARKSRFTNINIDLIYGFPGQSLDAWTRTVETTLQHTPDHLSMYSLAVEEHTPFAVEGLQVDGDLQADMYETARALLHSQGYAQYEISNFARPGKECRHNLIYWRGEDYIGAGVGAVGAVQGMRWQNHKSLEGYAKALEKGDWPRQSVETLEFETRRFERLMLGLRLREGLPWNQVEGATWNAERDRLAEKGWLEQIEPNIWRIPDPYVALTNQILLPFLPV